MYLNQCTVCYGAGCVNCGSLGYVVGDKHAGYAAIIFNPVKDEMVTRLLACNLTNEQMCEKLKLTGSQLALIIYRVTYMPVYLYPVVLELEMHKIGASYVR
jgi:hypothetical protein